VNSQGQFGKTLSFKQDTRAKLHSLNDGRLINFHKQTRRKNKLFCLQ